MKYFFIFYSFLWTVAIPFLKKHKRLKHGFHSRIKALTPLNKENHDKTVLLYTASGGEALLATYFIERNTALQDCTLCCFSWTKEGLTVFEKYIETSKRTNIRIFYAPFDKAALIRQSLINLNIQECYIIETEIWFGLLKALHELSIPFHFINARMTQKSFKLLSKFIWLFKNFPPSSISALSQEDLSRFQALFSLKESPSFKIEENLKFEQARRLIKENEKKSTFLDKERQIKIILFASIREQEEEDILSCIYSIYKNTDKQTLFILCPKQLDRSSAWYKSLHTLAPTFLAKENSLKQEELNYTENTFIIWNTFGDLQKLYQEADIVFVGGSLAPLGGQNFLEPLASGIIPYVGKYLDNFSWVFEKKPDIRSLGLIHEVENADFLAIKIVEELKKTEIKKKDIRLRFAQWLA